MKKKTFDRAFNWFKKKAIENKHGLLLSFTKNLQNSFKENFKKKSSLTIKGITHNQFVSWSFENDDWKVVKQHEATKLVFRIHFKNNDGRKRLIKRYFVKINWNEHL